MLSTARAWEVLDAVPDPEIPVLSVCDLGIVRDVRTEGGTISVTVTPTYSGCPATETISGDIRGALLGAGAEHVEVRTRLDPPWSTDWISEGGREKLRRHGIAPPHAVASDTPRPVRIFGRAVQCPRCGSACTTRLSAFGSTACKALYRCEACREPFDYFKPL
jgi:ring-1,2-phenylacetyl-CoA epoxidase subunit PaaD